MMEGYRLSCNEDNRPACCCVLRTMDKLFRTPLFLFSDVGGCFDEALYVIGESPNGGNQRQQKGMKECLYRFGAVEELSKKSLGKHLRGGKKKQRQSYTRRRR